MIRSPIKVHSKFYLEGTTKNVKKQLIMLLNNEKNWKHIKQNESSDKLIFKVKTSWQSWGESVVIKLNTQNDSNSVIEITSRPILFTTLFDYGKNQNNINKIKDVLGISY